MCAYHCSIPVELWRTPNGRRQHYHRHPVQSPAPDIHLARSPVKPASARPTQNDFGDDHCAATIGQTWSASFPRPRGARFITVMPRPLANATHRLRKPSSAGPAAIATTSPPDPVGQLGAAPGESSPSRDVLRCFALRADTILRAERIHQNQPATRVRIPGRVGAHYHAPKSEPTRMSGLGQFAALSTLQVVHAIAFPCGTGLRRRSNRVRLDL